jgi:hypothetical protein
MRIVNTVLEHRSVLSNVPTDNHPCEAEDLFLEHCNALLDLLEQKMAQWAKHPENKPPCWLCCI